MDTKLKSNNKILTSLIIILILFIASVGMFKTYPLISKMAKNVQYNYFETYDFVSILTESSYVLDYDILQQKSDGNIKPSDVFIDENKEKYYYADMDDSYLEDLKYRFNYDFNEWISNLKWSYSNLQYFALDKESGVTSTNMDNSIKITDDKNLDLSSMDKEKYRFIAVLNFDENGQVSISDVKGADKERLSSYMYKYEEYINGEVWRIISPIKNISYVFAVPQDLVYTDHISNNIDDAKYYEYEK